MPEAARRPPISGQNTDTPHPNPYHCVYCVLVFNRRGLCSPNWSGTCYTNQAGLLENSCLYLLNPDPPAFVHLVSALQVWASTVSAEDRTHGSVLFMQSFCQQSHICSPRALSVAVVALVFSVTQGTQHQTIPAVLFSHFGPPLSTPRAHFGPLHTKGILHTPAASPF